MGLGEASPGFMRNRVIDEPVPGLGEPVKKFTGLDKIENSVQSLYHVEGRLEALLSDLMGRLSQGGCPDHKNFESKEPCENRLDSIDISLRQHAHKMHENLEVLEFLIDKL